LRGIRTGGGSDGLCATFTRRKKKIEEKKETYFQKNENAGKGTIKRGKRRKKGVDI